MPVNWDEAFEEVAHKTGENYVADSPEEIAARREEEHLKGVRLGWWDKDGNPLHDEEEDEDDN